MGDLLSMVLGIALLVGFVAALIAYKPLRDRLIVTKGYDADSSGNLLAGASILLPLVLGINVVQSPLVLVLLFLVPFVINVVTRMSKIGAKDAVLITVLQTFGFIWVVIKWIWNICNQMMGAADRGGSAAVNRRNADAARKQELYRQYQATVEDAERHRDMAMDAMGGDAATDAAVAAAETEYQRKASEIDHEWQ